MSIGLGEAGDDVDMFVPVGGDQDGVSGRRWGGIHGHRALAMSVIPGSGVGSHQNLFLRAMGRRIDFAKSCMAVVVVRSPGFGFAVVPGRIGGLRILFSDVFVTQLSWKCFGYEFPVRALYAFISMRTVPDFLAACSSFSHRFCAAFICAQLAHIWLLLDEGKVFCRFGMSWAVAMVQLGPVQRYWIVTRCCRWLGDVATCRGLSLSSSESEFGGFSIGSVMSGRCSFLVWRAWVAWRVPITRWRAMALSARWVFTSAHIVLLVGAFGLAAGAGAVEGGLDGVGGGGRHVANC